MWSLEVFREFHMRSVRDRGNYIYSRSECPHNFFRWRLSLFSELCTKPRIFSRQVQLRVHFLREQKPAFTEEDILDEKHSSPFVMWCAYHVRDDNHEVVYIVKLNNICMVFLHSSDIWRLRRFLNLKILLKWKPNFIQSTCCAQLWRTSKFFLKSSKIIFQKPSNNIAFALGECSFCANH